VKCEQRDIGTCLWCHMLEDCECISWSVCHTILYKLLAVWCILCKELHLLSVHIAASTSWVLHNKIIIFFRPWFIQEVQWRYRRRLQGYDYAVSTWSMHALDDFFSWIHKWIAYLCIKMEESLDTHRVAQGECHATRRLSFSTRMHALDDKFRFLYEMPFAAVWSSNIELFLSFLINMIVCTVKIHSISRSPFYIYCCWRFSDVGIYRENMS
jgi:hypothetical protein